MGNDRQASREHWLVVAILVVGALLRLTYLLDISRAPDFDAPQFEAQYHDYWARALLSGDWTPPEGVTDPEIPQRPYFRPPGYPYFLAAVYGVLGPSYAWPRVVQMLLGLVSCWLIHRLARRVFGPAAAILALALAAVCWVFLFFEGELMAVSLLIFLLLAALSLAARWIEAFTLGGAAATGAVLGAAALVRPNAAALVPVFLLWAVWLWWRRRRASSSAGALLAPAAGLVAAVLLVTAPATLRNWRVAHDLVWITSNAGVNLFVGTHPESDGYRPGVRELGTLAGLDGGWDSFDYPLIARGVERATGRSLADSEVSAYFTRRAWDYVRYQPGAVARLTLRKLALFWGPAEISNNKVLHFEREGSPTLRLGPSFATLLALAIAGVLLWTWQARSGTSLAGAEPRRSLEVGVLLLASVAVYSVSYLPFFVSARFRAPLVPIMILFAGHALAGLWRTLTAGPYRALLGGILAVALLRAVTGIAWVPYEPDEALWHWRKGLLWKAKGELDRAHDEFQQAVAADPNDAEARLSLAESLAAARRFDEAAGEYRATLSLDPSKLAAHNNLAGILAARGDLTAAIAHWESALVLDPNRISVLTNLAYALATHDDPAIADPARAVELAERAAELTRRANRRVLATLEITYRAAGRKEDAERIRPDPDAQ